MKRLYLLVTGQYPREYEKDGYWSEEEVMKLPVVNSLDYDEIVLCGGEEEMVLNLKFVNDVQYIQDRFGIQGGETPDRDFVALLQHYVRELESYLNEHKADKTCVPEWAHKLMLDRYGMKLHS